MGFDTIEIYLVFSVFCTIQGICKEEGGKSILDWGGFKGFSLNSAGVIQRLTSRFLKKRFILGISSNRHSLHLSKNGEIHVSVIFVILQIADSQDIGFVTILISKEIQHLGQRLKSVSSSNASSTTSAFRAFLSDIQLKSLGFCLNALKGCELLENVSL